MFSKGSRYRNLAELTPVNARGERSRSKELRFIPFVSGRFLHTVHEGDRLDLLAFKFYGDATKWWQINDANTTFAFPIDVLDQWPVIEESLVLTSVDFNVRLEELLLALGSFGEVTLIQSDFSESIVAVTYAPSPTTRGNILNAIAGKKFHLLRTFAWSIDANTAEVFGLEDIFNVGDNWEGAKFNWQELLKDLAATPGILRVQSSVTEATLRVIYNSEMVRRGDDLKGREVILAQVQAHGFALMPESTVFSRLGDKIVVPPNQIV